MELDPVIAIEGLGHRLLETPVGIEPRHLVLVLVGKQLEVAARDCFCETAAARCLFLF